MNQFPIHKFKVNDKTFEFGYIYIEKKKDEKIHYIIFRNNMKSMLYQGFIFNKLTTF